MEHINTAWGRAWVSAQYHGRRGVFLPLVYVDINEGNLTDALVFAQIMYWHEPNRENGKSRLRIKHEGQWWLAKNHGDWWAEVRINKRVVRACLERIRDRGLIVYELHGMSGKKTPYIRVNWEQFEQAVKAATQPDTGLLTPPDEMGMGSNGDGSTPDETGSPPCPETYPPLPKKVKPNTEIFKDLTAENTTESLLEGVAYWVTGPVPIPKLLLLPAPKVNAVEAIAFFKANIDAVNPYLETVIETACRNYGLAAVMAALRYAAKRNAKRWAYVAKRLKGQAEERANQMARAKTYQDILAEIENTPPLYPLPEASGRGMDAAGEPARQDAPPTNGQSQTNDRVQAVCQVKEFGGKPLTAVRAWALMTNQIELQLDNNMTFDTYIRDLRLVDYRAESATFVVAAQTAHVRDICAKSPLGRHIARILGDVCSPAGELAQVEFIYQEKREAA